MVKICESGGESILIIDGLTSGQANRIASCAAEILEEERINRQKANTAGLGMQNIIPCGRYFSLTVDDVFQQHGFDGILHLLRCVPGLQKKKPCDSMFFSVPYPFIIKIYAELMIYSLFVVLDSFTGESALSLSALLDLFGDFLESSAKDSGYDSVEDIHPDEMPKEQQNSLRNKLLDSLRDRWVLFLNEELLPEDRIFSSDQKILTGMHSGFTIWEVFVSDRNRGIAEILLSTGKSAVSSSQYRAAVLFALALLKHREYLPFQDFLSAYGVFFPSLNSESLLSESPEKQETEYEKLAKSLGNRMLNSLKNSADGSAA